MKSKTKNVGGKWIGGALLAAGVAAVFLVEVKPEPEAEDKAIRPIKSLVVGGGIRSPKVYFPGTLEAETEVDLSFEVGGRLVEFPVRRGQLVKKGEVLGRLDARDYENQARNAEADLELAKSTLGRMEKALAANAVSQEEYAQARASVDKAEAQLSIRKKALEDTTLEARFDGVVSDTYADNYDTVAPGTPVLKLQDVGALAIGASVPEGYVLMATDEFVEKTKFTVEFDAMPGRSFAARPREFATTADPATQTYRAKFSMEKPEGVVLLPGMSGTVVVEPARKARKGSVGVPSDAVGFASDGQAFVWVLEDQGGGICKAVRRDVALGERTGEWIEVAEGIEGGTRVAAAGVAILTEGRLVRPLEATEAKAETAP